MIGGLLSISIAFGCGLVLMSFSEMNLLPPEVMARVGWSIIAFSILGYCLKTLFEKSKKLQETTFKIKVELRPSRLKAKNEISTFLLFCSKYWTKYLQNGVQGTNELMDRGDEFKTTIKSEGDLAMPGLSEKISKIYTNAVKLQKLIDRYRSEDNRKDIESLIDWFSGQEKEIEELFKPHLDITK